MRMKRKDMRPGTVFLWPVNRHCASWRDVVLHVVDNKTEVSARGAWYVGDIAAARELEVLVEPPNTVRFAWEGWTHVCVPPQQAVADEYIEVVW